MLPSDRADLIIVCTTAATLITALLSLWQSFRAGRAGTDNAAQIVLLKHEINSRLTELLERTAEASRAAGHKEGTEQERNRGFPPPETR